MSTLMDGINNAYSLTAQINTLRSMDKTKIKDPKAIEYVLQQNFNTMLNDLVSATSDYDNEEKDASGDYFSFLNTNRQSVLPGMQAQGTSGSDPIPATDSPEYLNALYNLGQLY